MRVIRVVFIASLPDWSLVTAQGSASFQSTWASGRTMGKQQVKAGASSLALPFWDAHQA